MAEAEGLPFEDPISKEEEAGRGSEGALKSVVGAETLDADRAKEERDRDESCKVWHRAECFSCESSSGADCWLTLRSMVKTSVFSFAVLEETGSRRRKSLKVGRRRRRRRSKDEMRLLSVLKDTLHCYGVDRLSTDEIMKVALLAPPLWA